MQSVGVMEVVEILNFQNRQSPPRCRPTELHGLSHRSTTNRQTGYSFGRWRTLSWPLQVDPCISPWICPFAPEIAAYLLVDPSVHLSVGVIRDRWIAEEMVQTVFPGYTPLRLTARGEGAPAKSRRTIFPFATWANTRAIKFSASP